MKKFALLIAILMSCLLITASQAAKLDPEIESLLNKIKANQSQVKDIQADIFNVVKGNNKKIEQKGHMWVKGEDYSKMEVLEPVKQITITNKDKACLIDPATGRKLVQDLKKIREKTGDETVGKSSGLAAALDAFDFKKLSSGGGLFGGGDIIIEGTPKKKGSLMGKVNYYIDKGRSLPVKIEIFDDKNNLLSKATISYEKIKDIWVISKTMSEIKMPKGKMEVEMIFSNIKVNEGIPDKEFKIE